LTLVDKIFAHACAAPNRPALTYRGRTYGYHALASLVLKARTWFGDQAVDRDKVAILYIQDMAQAWVVGLALRSLGVSTVSGRVPADLEQLGLGVLTVVMAGAESWPDVAEAAARERFPLIRAPAGIFDETALAPADTLQRPPGQATGAHILMTSATTGLYKKIVADPAYEAEEVRDRISQFPELGPDTVVDMFGFGGWTAIGYFVPMIIWRLGGRLVLDDGPEFWRSLAARDVTMAYVHPGLLAYLLALPPEIDLRNDAMTLVVIAGVLSEGPWLGARERLTTDVRTTLGSTEAGCCCVTRIETRDDLTWHKLRGPDEVQILDEAHHPLPIGEVGQMRVRLNRAASYLGDPDATKAFFRDGYFYPGDLAVLRGDGRLALRGRVTDVINVLGSKYPSLPIEAALQEQLSAEAVHVFSHTGDDGEEVHVVVQPTGPITAGDLKAALMAALPPIAHVRFHPVKSFPRNSMGKIDRKALKAQLGIGATR
jgi:acyl-coenzyme A synthetase/AMP-(fatty) acid ligase